MKYCLPIVLLACAACACSSDKTDSPTATPSNATVKIVTPAVGDSFEVTPDVTDMDVVITETNFTLVALGMEGNDMTKGQVRLYVDDMSCDDPGDGAMPVPLEYNRILPNQDGENNVGLDYCAGGVPAVDDKDHTLKAQLWHGTTPLTGATGADITDQVTFHTTFSATGAAGAAGAAAN